MLKIILRMLLAYLIGITKSKLVTTLSHFQVAKSYISENLLNRPYQINVNIKCIKYLKLQSWSKPNGEQIQGPKQQN